MKLLNFTYSMEHILPEIKTTNMKRLLHILRDMHPNDYLASVRTATLSYAIGQELLESTRISPAYRHNFLLSLAKGGLFHDIGKVGLQPDFLNYGKFTPEMYNECKKHTEGGASILQFLGAEEELCLIALHHHERFDGTGYPLGKSGFHIPLQARIVTIADGVDAALSLERKHYKDPIEPSDLFEDITSKASSWYDQRVVLAFIMVHQKIMNKHPEPTREQYFDAIVKNYGIKKVFSEDEVLSSIFSKTKNVIF